MLCGLGFFYTVPGLGCVCVVSCGGLCYVGACVECVTYGLNVVYRVRWYCVGLFCVWTRGEERVRYDLDHHSYEEYLLTGQRKNQDKQKSSRGNWG